MKNILVIGCSNGHRKHRALRQVFQEKKSEEKTISNGIDGDEFLIDEYCTYSNLSMSGAGNLYIRHRLFDYIKKQLPDYVYLQFSGLIRRDVYFLQEAQDIFLNAATSGYKIVDDKIFMGGGNLIDDTISTWQKKIFSMMYSKNYSINNYESLQEVFLCLSILEKLRIRHNYTFYYDPTNPPTEITRDEGTLSKFPDFINCQNLLPSPLNFAIENGYSVADGVHFGDEAFLDYVRHHKEKFHVNLDDK